MIMFMCAGIVVMSSSGNVEGVTVVYGTRASGLVMLSLFFLIQSGLAGVVSSVHVSFSRFCPGSYSGHVILLHIQGMQYAGSWESQCGYFEYEEFRRCGCVEADVHILLFYIHVYSSQVWPSHGRRAGQLHDWGRSRFRSLWPVGLGVRLFSGLCGRSMVTLLPESCACCSHS